MGGGIGDNLVVETAKTSNTEPCERKSVMFGGFAGKTSELDEAAAVCGRQGHRSEARSG